MDKVKISVFTLTYSVQENLDEILTFFLTTFLTFVL